MRAALLAIAMFMAFSAPAYPAEKVITLKLVTKLLEMKDGEARFFGATFTPDGRAGIKEYTFRPAEGAGQSTYSWDDGSSITATFKTASEKGHYTGEYTILSGTGAYNGASGTGTLKGRDPTASGLKGAGVFDIVLKVNVPSN